MHRTSLILPAIDLAVQIFSGRRYGFAPPPNQAAGSVPAPSQLEHSSIARAV